MTLMSDELIVEDVDDWWYELWRSHVESAAVFYWPIEKNTYTFFHLQKNHDMFKKQIMDHRPTSLHKLI